VKENSLLKGDIIYGFSLKAMLMENRSMVTEIRNEEESYNRIGERVLY
jgi:hypothetical protein